MKSLLFVFLLLLSSAASAAILGIPMKNRVPVNGTGEIEICWLGSTTSETLPLREKIQKYLISEVSARAGMTLKFLPDCFKEPNPFSPIGFAFFDAIDNSEGLQGELMGTVTNRKIPGHPTTYSKGHRSQKNFTDLILTSHFKQVHPGLEKQVAGLSAQGAENLLLSIALHEFLHVLGFNHEQNRPDSPCTEGAEKFNPRVATLLSPYDPDSIMNYCNTHFHDFEKGPLPLSNWDLVGIRALMK